MSDIKIQMVDLLGQFREIETEVMEEIQKVIESSSFINGPTVKEFSERLGNYLGTKHVIPCGNGTDALQIALMALNLPEGAKIAVPAFTYIATVEVIALLKYQPVFVEVDHDTFTMDPKHLGEIIQQNEISAIIPVHLYGQSADMNGIFEVLAGRNIPIIEDNAQAIGASYNLKGEGWKKTGTLGTIGTTSFFPTKNLGAFGDGGAISTNDADLAEILIMTASHGQSKKYYHDIIGVNSRLDSVQAAILKVKLGYLDEYASKRQKVAKYYDEALSDIDGFKIPLRNPDSTHVFHQYTIKVLENKRDDLQEYLKSKGIPSMVYYPLAQHRQKAYLHYDNPEGSFPISEALCHEVLSLPVHTQLKEEELVYICSTIKTFFDG